MKYKIQSTFLSKASIVATAALSVGGIAYLATDVSSEASSAEATKGNSVHGQTAERIGKNDLSARPPLRQGGKTGNLEVDERWRERADADLKALGSVLALGPDEAVAGLEAILEYAPRHGQTLYWLGAVELLKRADPDLRLAREHFGKALEDVAGSPAWLSVYSEGRIAQTLLKEKRYFEARSKFERLETTFDSTHPGSPDTSFAPIARLFENDWINAIRNDQSIGKEGVLDRLKGIADINTGTVVSVERLATKVIEGEAEGEYAGVLERLEAALAMEDAPDFLTYERRLKLSVFRLANRLGEPAVAAEMRSELIGHITLDSETERSDITTYTDLIVSEGRDSQDFKRAAETLAQASEAIGGNSYIEYWMADALYQAGDNQGAKRQIVELLESDLDYPWMRGWLTMRLAWVEEKGGDPKAARRLAEEAGKSSTPGDNGLLKERDRLFARTAAGKK